MGNTESKLKLGIIGAGHWGPNLIRNFHEGERSEVRWVADLDSERLHFIKERYGDVQVTEDWEVVLKDPEVEAVVVCSPTKTHYAIVEAALNAGKHVFVEKPITTHYQEAKYLVRLAETKGLKLMVGHVFLFNAGIQTVKKVLDSGELGQLHYIYSTRTNLGPIRPDVSALWDLAPHDISIVLYLLGELPQSVGGHGTSFINPPIEDVCFSRLYFKDNVFANLHVSWLDPKKVRQLVLVGEKKMLVFDDMETENSVKLFDKNVGDSLSKSIINDTIVHFRKSIVEGNVSYPEVPPAEPLRNECMAFVDWILDGQEQPSDGVLGAEVVQILELVEKSIRSGGHLLNYPTENLGERVQDDRPGVRV